MCDGRLGMLRENRELVLDLLYLDFSTIYALSWQEMVMPVSIHYALDTSRRHQFRYHKSVRRNRLGTALLLGCSDLKIAKGSREFYRIMSNETIGEATVPAETPAPHRISPTSSMRRVDTPARYISMMASSTLVSRLL